MIFIKFLTGLWILSCIAVAGDLELRIWGNLVSGSFDLGDAVEIFPKVSSISLTNSSSSTITNIELEIDGGDTSSFTHSQAAVAALQPGESVSYSLIFRPKLAGIHSATLSVRSGVDSEQVAEGSIILKGRNAYSPVVSTRLFPTSVSRFDATHSLFGEIIFSQRPVDGYPIPLVISDAPIGDFLNVKNGEIVAGRFQGQSYTYRITIDMQGNRYQLVLIPIAGAKAVSSFAPAVGTGGIGSVAVQPDGRIIISSMKGLIRLNRDGSTDHSFKRITDWFAESLVFQVDGKILCAGIFGLPNYGPGPFLMRLEKDGSIDESFKPALNDRSSRVFYLPNGQIMVGGSFSKVGDQDRMGLARLNVDGSLDPTFNAGIIASNFVLNVFALAAQEDGKILAGGSFNLPDGRLSFFSRFHEDGSVDESFDMAVDSGVSAIVFQPDGKMIVGGHFSKIKGSDRIRIARLSLDGTLDESFSMKNAANHSIANIVLQADGKMIIGGQFASIDGVSRAALARLTKDGDLDLTFNPGGNNSFTTGLALTEDGSIVVVGSFGFIGGANRSGIAMLENEAGSSSLVVSGDQIEWKRSGAVPEIYFSLFETSTDSGVTWTPLGSGARTAEGWKLTNAVLPTSGFLRARGREVVGNRGHGMVGETTLFGRSLTTLEGWRQGAFRSPLNDGAGADLADADLDGVKNLVEYGFGLDPKSAASRALPGWSFLDGGYEVEFQKPAGVEGISYGAEWSETLEAGDWHPAENMSADGWEAFRVPVTSQPKMFFRLKVANP